MENKYYTAETYENCERIGEPFDKKGKLYTKIRCACGRCGGTGIIVSLTMPDQGMCYNCYGSKYYTKEVRLYTEKEIAAMKKAKERKQEKKDAEMRAEAASKRASWLQENGFTAEGKTYVYALANSYSVKETLKEEGFKFSPVLKWHIAEVPEEYASAVVEIDVNDIIEFSAWGYGQYKTGSGNIVDAAILAVRPASKSEYVGQPKDKISELEVVLDSVSGFNSQFGWTNIYKFKAGDDILVWFTKTAIGSDLVGKTLFLNGTVKEHKEYNNEKQTVLTRVKVKEVE